MSTRVTLLKVPARRRTRGWAAKGAKCVATLVVLLVLLETSDLLPPEFFARRLSEQTTGMQFDFFGWEWTAMLAKVGMELIAPQDTLKEAQRQRLVTDYIDVLRRSNELEGRISAIHSRLQGQDAVREAEPWDKELSRLRTWMRARQDMVESILEEQVSEELEAESLGKWGYVWPPVKIRLTELPLLLVVSSRAAITREADVDLKDGLELVEQERLEDRVDRTFDSMRSLVTPIGGLSAYPAMILEHPSLVWLTDTFAHEWTHHFLLFHPLGYGYRESGEMTSINETTCDIVGREVGRRVILRYYPALGNELPPLPVPPASPPMSAGEIVWPDEPPADQFDYDREMRTTRIRVDELLAEGQIEEAEAYMEERRRLIVDHGYSLRKLNQAYFAFYGSYASSPSMANPIGGQLDWLRAQSPTLRGFLLRVAAVATHEQFLGLLGQG